jgi:opacity protein-like surface antigen
MKNFVLALALLAMTVSVSQAQLSFSGGPHGGLTFSSFPEGVKEFYGIGFGGGAHADLNIASFLTTRLNFDYNTFPSDKAKLKTQFRVTDPNGNPTNNFDVVGGNVSIIGVSLNGIGKIPTGSSVTPYGMLGFGLHILNQSELKVNANGNTLLTIPSPSSDTNFGLNFGAGVEFGLGYRTKLFVDVKYVLIFTQNANSLHLPVTVGLSF